MIRYIAIAIITLSLYSCDKGYQKKHRETNIGIDVSSYQGHINWELVSYTDVSFVFIRSSMGVDKDRKFSANYNGAKKHGLKVSAYHYYRPNENSIRQAESFLKSIRGCSFDMPIVLDIESRSTIQSDRRLILGLHKFCDKIESETGNRPIIYSGDHFFSNVLMNDFQGHELWIADYTNEPDNECSYWQHSQTGSIDGIKGHVDLNVKQLH